MLLCFVSVPLRGFRSLIRYDRRGTHRIYKSVSVPLRGFRSLILVDLWTDSDECYFASFRPLTGIPFLNKYLS